ncbi:MAG TPA: energy-coupling factor ABC transporter substrate-binding protein [Azospirillaceae bacterium]|nr:energy-coupling factor ABC transporter substrate-binding protein [Azospirillaceae bacterium]
MGRNVALVLGAAALVAAPLVLPATGGLDEPFSGTDNKAANLIAEQHPDYRPWAQSLWKPPSPEIESLLFALQAAIGAGVLGYIAGYRRGRNAGRRDGDARD